jgi:hypothetical protein
MWPSLHHLLGMEKAGAMHAVLQTQAPRDTHAISEY